MNFYFNGIEIQDGEKHYFNDAHIKDIYLKRKIDSDYLHVYQYDNTEPILSLSSPTTGQWSLLNKRAYTIAGVVSDAESGISSVTLNGDSIPVQSDGSFSVSPTADTNVLVVTNGAGLSVSKTISVGSAQYYDNFSGDRTHTPGNVKDDCWKQCNICGMRWSWRVDTAGNWKEGDHAPEHCPNNHYKYEITVT